MNDGLSVNYEKLKKKYDSMRKKGLNLEKKFWNQYCKIHDDNENKKI